MRSLVYLVYWGAAEPLGRSLVLPAVRDLAASGLDVELVTFEKPADWGAARQQEIRTLLRGWKVRWRPRRYHKRPRIPATLGDVAAGAITAARAARSGERIVYARTFIGGLMGWMATLLTRRPLVFHAEGFYADEQVDAGVWVAGSAPHRLCTSLERRIFLRADAVVVLSEHARAEVERLLAADGRHTPVAVVPSCVDLGHFASARAPSDPGTLQLVYAGSVGGRYQLRSIARFAAAARGVFDEVHLRVITRMDPQLVASELADSGLPGNGWSVGAESYEDMPGALRSHNAGAHFLAGGRGDRGGSPTKVGEYWASGLPVVVTDGIGDTGDLARAERVGVVVGEHTSAAYEAAARELRQLLADPSLPERCRGTATRAYGLEVGTARILALLDGLPGRGA